jgi:hypothetical protein
MAEVLVQSQGRLSDVSLCASAYTQRQIGSRFAWMDTDRGVGLYSFRGIHLQMKGRQT